MFKLKNECDPEIPWAFYLFNENIYSDPQSGETVPLRVVECNLTIGLN
jgi:hypothetical protein